MQRIIIILCSILILLNSGIASATDLLELYQLAKTNDKKLQAAYHQNQADLQAFPQAIAAFLPTLTGSANTKGNRSTDPDVGKNNSWSYQLNLSQPIFRFADWAVLAQAQNKVKAAAANLEEAEQSMALRLANQYFAILKAQDDLTFAQSERKAFGRQLEQTQQRFKVGIIAITDVHEATAKRDSAYAREITTQNTLENEKEKIREIVGERVINVHELKDGITLPSLNPANIEEWVTKALEQNWQLQASRHNLAASKEGVRKEKAGHLPTITVDASIMKSRAPKPPEVKDAINNQDMALTLNMPIFNGGAVFYKSKAARESYEQAFANLEDQSRSVESNARQSYRNVTSKLEQIAALKQTVTSSMIALKATKAAFEVGTRTIVDVLNAQSDVLNAEKDFNKAHYDYITESLKLKKNAGMLGVFDLEAINKWLQPRSVANDSAVATENTTPKENIKSGTDDSVKEDNKNTKKTVELKANNKAVINVDSQETSKATSGMAKKTKENDVAGNNQKSDLGSALEAYSSARPSFTQPAKNVQVTANNQVNPEAEFSQELEAYGAVKPNYVPTTHE